MKCPKRTEEIYMSFMGYVRTLSRTIPTFAKYLGLCHFAMILRNKMCDNSYHRASFTLRHCERATKRCVNTSVLYSAFQNRMRGAVVGVSMHGMAFLLCVRVCRPLRRKTIRQTTNCAWVRRARKASTRITILLGCSETDEFIAIEMHRSEPATECTANRSAIEIENQWKEKWNWWSSNGWCNRNRCRGKLASIQIFFFFHFFFTLHFVAARNKLRITQKLQLLSDRICVAKHQTVVRVKL